MKKEEFKKTMLELQKKYKDGMLDLFDSMGISKSEFVDPVPFEPLTMYKVSLVLSSNTEVEGSRYLADGVFFSKYKFYFMDNFQVANSKSLYYYCDTLTEAQQSYLVSDIISVDIKPVELFVRRKKDVVYYE